MMRDQITDNRMKDKRWCLIGLNEKTLRQGTGIKAQMSKDMHIDVIGPDKFLDLEIKTYKGKLKEIVGDLFKEYDVLIFMMAMGIIVRDITPHIVHKSIDPAVLCLSPDGHYIIPVLSGHLGGANEASIFLASELGIEPVITTASDVFQVEAVDMIAKRHNLVIDSFQMAKTVTSMMVDDKPIIMTSDIKDVAIPESLKEVRNPLGSIDVTNRRKTYDLPTAVLVPKNIIIGIGARRGSPYETIRVFLDQVLEEEKLNRKAVSVIASIDIKADEEGIVELAKKLKVPFVTYSAKDLEQIEHLFEGSDFVKTITGTSSVCDASGYLASEKGRCLMYKKAYQGVTVSIWERS